MKKIKIVILFLVCALSQLSYASYATFGEALQATSDNVAAQNYKEARAILDEASPLAKADIEKANLYLLYGQIDVMESKYSDSRTEFQKVLGLQSIQPSLRLIAQMSVGLSYMSESKFSEARKSFLQAMSVDDVAPALKFNLQLQLARTYSLESNFTRAREEYEKLKTYQDETHIAKSLSSLLIGDSYIKEGKYSQARTEFEQVYPSNRIPDSSKKVIGPTDKASLSIIQRAHLGVAQSYLLEGIQDEAKREYLSILSMPNLDPSVKVEAEKQLRTAGVVVKSSIQPDKVVKPSRIFLGQVLSGSNVTKTIIVTSTEKIPFSIKSITSSVPQVVGKASSDVISPAHAVQFDTNISGKVGDVIDGAAKITFSDGTAVDVPIQGIVGDPSQFPHLEVPKLLVGQIAPDFYVLDTNGHVQHLLDLRGKRNLLLTFFPKCFTGGCANHLTSIQAEYGDFLSNDTDVLAVSVDPADGEQGQIAFAEQWGFQFAFIPDTSRQLSMLYGAAHDTTDLSSRMSVLIDKQGIVRFIDKSVNVSTHGADMLAKMKELRMIK